MLKADILFSKPDYPLPFEFNQKVADCFDDMALRSIPFYLQVQQMIGELVLRFFQEGSSVYDLGCSTGTSCFLFYQKLLDASCQDFLVHGMDSSSPMIELARGKMQQKNIQDKRLHFSVADILKEDFNRPSVVLLNYTLQFVPPLKREKLIRRIYEALPHKGVLIVSEKLRQKSGLLSQVFLDEYLELKRKNGYSELEIARKREALENVLVPYTLDEDINLFKSGGFQSVEVFFSWFNFSSFLCLKE